MVWVAGLVCAIALTGIPVQAQTAPGAAENDIRFDKIIEPVSWDGSDSTIYRGLIVSIPVKVRFFNAGTKTQTDVRVTFTYRDGSGRMLATTMAPNIRENWEPGTYRVVENPYFALTYLTQQFGDYSVEACAELVGDEVPENNCSHRQRFSWSTNPYEIQAGNPEQSDALPMPGRIYTQGDSLTPHATYLNMGTKILAGATARMIIQGPSGSIIYDDSTQVLPIDTVRRIRRTHFPSPLFLNDGPGTYQVTSIGMYKDDPFKKDDTASWTFQAGTAAGVRDGEGSGSAAATVLYPNPARDHFQVAYIIPGAATALLRMYGADGREVPVPAGDRLSGEGTITIPAYLLPSGLYTVVLELSDGTRQNAEVIIRH